MQDMKNPKISVIVPIFRVEAFLEKCVDSIRNQTYKNLEIILVDDSSDDGCPALCDEYAKQDERIKVIHQKNGGLSAARNSGLKIATGEYVGFVDSDDYIEPQMYERLVDTMMKQDVSLAICAYDYVTVDGEKMVGEEYESPLTDGLYDGKELLAKTIEKNGWFYVTAWNKLYKKEVWDNMFFEDGKVHEDEFVVHKVLLKCKQVAVVSDVLYHYLQNDKSIMHTGYSIKRLDRVEALLNRFEDCQKEMNMMWKMRMCKVIKFRFEEAKQHLSFSVEFKERYDALQNRYKDIMNGLSWKDRGMIEAFLLAKRV